MAKSAINLGLLTSATMNGNNSYRVSLSYGVFSIARKVTQSGVYYYASKRVAGKLYKVYVGKQGEITQDLLHKRTMELEQKIPYQHERSCYKAIKNNVGREK
ncbi:MAG: hypothetical protein WHX52_18510 [Anaerolineae bacterium]